MRHSYRTINGYKAKIIRRIHNLSPALANDITDLQLPWYYIRNQEDVSEEESDAGDNGATAEIFIYDEIGGSFGVAADEFVQDLQKINADNIIVRINSPGGSVFDAIAIYNALIQHPADITTRVDALAASAASIIAMAGDTVEMMVGAQLMIHDAMGAEMGNAAEMREMAKFLDAQSDNISTIYAHKGGGEPQDWRAMMLAETWMFAQEAVDAGLADSVYTRVVRRELESAEEADPEESPGPEKQEPPSEEPDEDDSENVANAVAALMNHKHVLTNRGWRFSGRERAPNPGLKAKAKASGFSDMIASWR